MLKQNKRIEWKLISRLSYLKNLGAIVLCLGFASVCGAQDAPATQTPAAPATPPPAAPAALSAPAVTGPLANLPPAIFDAGPFGKLAVNGIVSGMGLAQSNHIPGDNDTQAALSNGQVFLQKTDSWFQFYLQAGAYNLPSLGVPFLATDKTVTNLYGPLPVGYLKLAPQKGGWKNTSILIGELPTLMGAEYTFTFENMNVERGLLWNQETAISRGIQVNQTLGKVTASLSWNDGFYSNRYSWLMGSLTYTNGPNSLMFCAGGNLGETAYQTAATPVQNNGSMYMVMYTYTKGSWIIMPYWQYTSVPTNLKVGVVKGASTDGGALLVSHTFKHGFSLAGRGEYISSSGNPTDGSLNLMYGPGSAGTSLTVTPTFQKGGFFVRGDVSWVHASNNTPGFVFGPTGVDQNQVRAVAELGFIFGNNIIPKNP